MAKQIHHWLLVLVLAIAAFDLQLVRLAQSEYIEALDRAEATLRTTADVVLGRAEQMLDSYDRTMAGIAEALRLQGRIHDRPDLYVHRMLIRSHRITPGLRWLLIVGADGRLAESSASFPAANLDLSDREYYQTQVNNWERDVHISPPLTARTDGALFIPMSHRVVNDGNHFIGVVAAGIDPDEFRHLLTDQALPEGYRVRLVHRRGHALACLPATNHCLGEDWAAAPLFHSLLDRAPRGSGRHERLLDEPPGPAAYASSASYPIVVAASADKAVILAAWQGTANAYLLLAIGSNATLIGIGFFAFRQFQRRRQAMDDLAEANQRLEERVVTRTEELRRSEARARTFMDTAIDAVVVIDAASRIVEYNPAAERMFGRSAGEVIGQHLELLMAADMGSPHHGYVQAASGADQVRPMNRGREVLARHGDGHLFPVEVTVGSSGALDSRLHVGIIRDIRERKATETELLRLATTDGLTGLLNRRAFSTEAEALIALARRYRHPLSLLVLDVDRFKSINDRYGHPAGDAVLRTLAATIRGALRSCDVVGRLGGEEFAVVLPATPPPGALELGERLLAAVRTATVPWGEQTLALTVSIGLAWMDASGHDDLEHLFKRGDEALYRAKNAGRDRLLTQET